MVDVPKFDGTFYRKYLAEVAKWQGSTAVPKDQRSICLLQHVTQPVFETVMRKARMQDLEGDFCISALLYVLNDE